MDDNIYSEPGFYPTSTKDCKKKFGHINPQVVYDPKRKLCRPSLRTKKASQEVQRPIAPDTDSLVIEKSEIEKAYFINEINKRTDTAVKLREALKEYIKIDKDTNKYRVKKKYQSSEWMIQIAAIARKTLAKLDHSAQRSPKKSSKTQTVEDTSNSSSDQTKLDDYIRWIKSNAELKRLWDAKKCKEINPYMVREVGSKSGCKPTENKQHKSKFEAFLRDWNPPTSTLTTTSVATSSEPQQQHPPSPPPPPPSSPTNTESEIDELYAEFLNTQTPPKNGEASSSTQGGEVKKLLTRMSDGPAPPNQTLTTTSTTTTTQRFDHILDLDTDAALDLRNKGKGKEVVTKDKGKAPETTSTSSGLGKMTSSVPDSSNSDGGMDVTSLNNLKGNDVVEVQISNTREKLRYIGQGNITSYRDVGELTKRFNERSGQIPWEVATTAIVVGDDGKARVFRVIGSEAHELGRINTVKKLTQ